MFDFRHRITEPYKTHRIMCGAIIVMDEKITLVQKASKKFHGRWGLPEGIIAKGENIFESAKRKVHEQTNLSIHLRGLVGIYNWYSEETRSTEIHYIFLASDPKGTSKPNISEILPIKEFSMAEIMAMPDASFSYPQFRQVIKDYRRGKLYPLEVINIL